MDTLKQNNYLFKVSLCLIFTLLLQGCDDKEKKKLNELKTCYDDSEIIINNEDKLSFGFNGKYKDKIVKEIDYISFIKGTFERLNFEKNKVSSYNKIKLKDKIILNTKDTIEIIFNDKSKITLHDFRNEPEYGGKNFLGCYLGYCMSGEDTIRVSYRELWIR